MRPKCRFVHSLSNRITGQARVPRPCSGRPERSRRAERAKKILREPVTALPGRDPQRVFHVAVARDRDPASTVCAVRQMADRLGGISQPYLNSNHGYVNRSNHLVSNHLVFKSSRGRNRLGPRGVAASTVRRSHTRLPPARQAYTCALVAADARIPRTVNGPDDTGARDA